VVASGLNSKKASPESGSPVHHGSAQGIEALAISTVGLLYRSADYRGLGKTIPRGTS
jgi:hypothetical protein